MVLWLEVGSMYDILAEKILTISVLGGNAESVSLPKVYAALMEDQVEAFPALRPHQRHAWHAFLVQLGVIAMHKAGLTEPLTDPDEWHRIIRALTKDDFPDDEPWHLVVEDITKPAFMQPPASSKEREKDYKNPVLTPDQLDMLVTSKNHDLKSTVAGQTNFNDWIFALVTLQTMEGFAGAGNYGIARMNGGLGNRPAFSLVPFEHNAGIHVKRDVLALLELFPDLICNSPGSEDGEALLWTVPWDGDKSESLLVSRLHPLFIEVCRRVRLRSSLNGSLHAVRTTSKAARIQGKELKGRTGDPWTPHNPSRDGLPLTLSNGGFTYKRIADYLTAWTSPLLLKASQSELRSHDTMKLVATATVRGQGKTEGHYERVIPFRRAAYGVFGRRGATELGDMARKRIDEVAIVQRILSHAIQTFVARGEPENASPEHRTLARRWLNRLDVIVDATFFEKLQDEFEADPVEHESIRYQWLLNGNDGVVDHARRLLQEATDSLPCPAIFRYKARVRAEGLFEGRIRGNQGLAFLFDDAKRK